MTEDEKLIDEVRIAFDAKDITDLSQKIGITHITLAKWKNSGKIPDNGTAKKYLKLLLENKRLNDELQLYRKLGQTFNEILNLTKNEQ